MKMILLAGASALALAACSTAAPQPYYGSAYAPYDTYYGSYYGSSTPPTCCGGYLPYAGAPLAPPNPNVR